MCARTDHQFGLVMDALKGSGLYDDAAVFFFSDHADFTGDYGLVEKTQNTYEDFLMRVPFIIKPPKRAPVRPRVSEAMVELMDFAATVFDLTGIEPDYTHFSRSLLPLVAGEVDDHRDAVFAEGGRLYGERHAMELGPNQDPEGLYWPRVGLQCRDDGPYHTKGAMCRTKSFKYVRRLYEQDELYDLEEDPQELHNIVEEPAYAEVLAQLKERMLTWYLETCDVVPHEEDPVALSGI
jgi:arylsulfatase A-like enzyme